MYLNPDHKKRLQTITSGGVIAAVIYALYLLCQIMGWIPNSQIKEEKDKPVQEQVEQQVNSEVK